MTSVTGSPTGKPAPANARASCAANIVVPSIVAHRVVEECDVPVREGPHWRQRVGQRGLDTHGCSMTLLSDVASKRPRGGRPHHGADTPMDLPRSAS
jgi:hypothetical protein